VYDLPSWNKAEVIFPRFNKEMEKRKGTGKLYVRNAIVFVVMTNTIVLLKRSVMRALHAAFGLNFWWSVILATTSVIFTLGTPIIMQYLLIFIGDSTKPVYEGYLLAVGLFMCSMLSSFFLNQYMNVSMVRLSTRVFRCFC